MIDSRKAILAAAPSGYPLSEMRARVSSRFWIQAQAEARYLETPWGRARHEWQLAVGPCSPGRPSLQEAAEYWGVESVAVVEGQDEDVVLSPVPLKVTMPATVSPDWTVTFDFVEKAPWES